MTLDQSLLYLFSKQLACELVRAQRSRYLLVHPLFNMLCQHFEDVMQDICVAFRPQVYADGEIVSPVGVWAESRVITAHGSFQLEHGGPRRSVRATMQSDITDAKAFPESSPRQFNEVAWFAEVALFTRVMHQSILRALSFRTHAS